MARAKRDDVIVAGLTGAEFLRAIRVPIRYGNAREFFDTTRFRGRRPAGPRLADGTAGTGWPLGSRNGRARRDGGGGGNPADVDPVQFHGDEC